MRYEYKCLSCGVAQEGEYYSEAQLRDGEGPCETCGSNTRRIYHPPVVTFRGGGFYSTDNARSGRASVRRKAGS